MGGSSDLEGRVEVCSGGVWGTVCDDLWSGVDANVVCGQLGYSNQGMQLICHSSQYCLWQHKLSFSMDNTTGAIARSRAFFGQGSGDILLDNVGCTGNETRLIDCTNNGIGVHNCVHAEDAGVTCLSREITTPPRMNVCIVVLI